MHEHTIQSETERCFSACLDPRDCNPAAHGGIRVLQLCDCGMSRPVNRNQGHVEVGSWERREDTHGYYVWIYGERSWHRTWEAASRVACKVLADAEHINVIDVATGKSVAW